MTKPADSPFSAATGRVALFASLIASSIVLGGCWGSTNGGNYCESGPKYGTQCYYVNDRNEAQPVPNRSGPPPQNDRSTPPPNGYR